MVHSEFSQPFFFTHVFDQHCSISVDMEVRNVWLHRMQPDGDFVHMRRSLVGWRDHGFVGGNKRIIQEGSG